MRQQAHAAGAAVLPVLVQPPVDDRPCKLLAAAADVPVAEQVDAAHSACTSPPAASQQSDAGEPPDAEGPAAPCHLLALPAECNVTGLRPSRATMHAVTHGKACLLTVRAATIQRCSLPSLCALARGTLHAQTHRSNRQHNLSRDTQGCPPGEVLVLLDAAKAAQAGAVPDLAVCPAHFLCVSFYKVFGWPTGLGALIVRTDVLPLLRPPFLGGGTLRAVLPATWPSAPQPRVGAAAFEAGTLNYQAIAQLQPGWRAWEGGEAQQALQLARQLAQRLSALCYDGGLRAVHVYGWPHCVGAGEQGACIGIGEAPAEGGAWRGATVAFNVQNGAGDPVGCQDVARHLARHGVALRAGCCCNPGACAALLHHSDADLVAMQAAGWRCGGDVWQDVWRGSHTGVVRASLGRTSAQADIDALVSVLESAVAARVWDAVPDTGDEPSAFISHTHARQAAPAKVASSPESGGNSISRAANPAVTAPLRVAALFVYPVKSCRGTAVAAWPLTAAGLLHDRSFLLIDRSGAALTCRRHPRLARLTASVDLARQVLVLAWLDSGEHCSAGQGGLQCDSGCCGPERFQVPLPQDAPCGASGSDQERHAMSGEPVDVRCSGRVERGALVHCAAGEASVHEWLSRRLQQPVFLVRVLSRRRDSAAPAATGSLVHATACSLPRTRTTISVGQRAVAWRGAGGGDVGTTHSGVPLAGQSFNATGALLVATVASAELFVAKRAASVPSTPMTGSEHEEPCSQRSTHGGRPAACSVEACATGEQFRVNVLLAAEADARDDMARGCSCASQEGQAAERSAADFSGAHAEDEWDGVQLSDVRASRARCSGDERCACAEGAETDPSAQQGVVLRVDSAAERCAAVNVPWRQGPGQAGNLGELARYRKRGGRVTWGVFATPELEARGTVAAGSQGD